MKMQVAEFLAIILLALRLQSEGKYKKYDIKLPIGNRK